MPATRTAMQPVRDTPAQNASARPPFYYLADLWISLTRCLTEVAQPKASKYSDWSVRDHLICSAIYLGTIEGRSMTSTNIAADIGVPRPTVARHLEVLQRRRLVKRRGNIWSTPEDLLILRHQQNFKRIIKSVRIKVKGLP